MNIVEEIDDAIKYLVNQTNNILDLDVAKLLESCSYT